MFSLFPDTNVSAAKKLARPARKRGLIIGLNYGDSHKLSGKQEEARRVADMMSLRLFCTDTRIMCDTNTITKPQVLDALDWLTEGSESGDVLFFHFSGLSSADFCMVLEDQGITQEEFKQLLIEPLPLGTTLFCVFDSGFKGFDLRFRFDSKSTGPVSSVPVAGYRKNALAKKWNPSLQNIENLEVAETSASIVVVFAEKGPVTWAYLQALEDVYLHSLSLGVILARMHAFFAANGLTVFPSFESGQNIDPKVPFGRYVSAPI